MKKKVIISIIVLFVAVVIGVGSYFLFSIFQAPAQIEDTEAQFQTTLKETPNDGTNPNDHTIEDNIAYALYKITVTDEFKTVTNGDAVAVGVAQTVYNERVVKNGKAMNTMITSGFIQNAKQRYFMKDKVLLRNATDISARDTATWATSEPECVTYDTIKKRYGWFPTEATGYIICSDTFLNPDQMTMVDNQDGTFTISFDLNPEPDKAPFWYRREVLTNSNSTIIPEFFTVHFEMKIDKNWTLVQNTIDESYKVKSFGVEAVTNTHCVEDFYYENIEFDKDAYDFFESFGYLNALEDSGDGLETKLDPLSIIVESLQNKDGSDKLLNVDIQVKDNHLNGNVALNITDVENVKVVANLDDLYVEYTDKIYFAIGGMKASLDTSDIGALLERLKGVLPQSGSTELDVNQILDDLGKASMQEVDSKVIIDGTLNLAGISLPLHFEIAHENDTYSLISASSTIDLNDEKIDLTLKTTTTKPIVMDKTGFMSLKNLDFVIEDVVSIIENKKLDIDASLEYEGINIHAYGHIDFNNSIKATLNVTLTHESKSIDLALTYLNDTVYIDFSNLHLKVTKDDLMSIVSKYVDVNVSLDMDNLDINSILTIVLNLDYDKLIKEVIIEKDHLAITADLEDLVKQINEIKLELRNTDYGMDGYVSVLGFNVDFKLGDLNYTLKDIDDINYQNLAYLAGYIDYALAIFDSKELELEMNLTYQDILVSLDAIIDFNEELKLNANGLITYHDNSINVSATYVNDMLYADLSGIKVSIKKETITNLLDSYVNTGSIDLGVLFTLDYDSLIKSFTLAEDEIALAMNLSSIVNELSDISVKLKLTDVLQGNISIKDFADVNVTLKKTDAEILAPTEEYSSVDNVMDLVNEVLDLVSEKKLVLTASLSYDELDIEAEALVDFTEDLKLSANVTLAYDSKTIETEVYYLKSYKEYEDVILVHLANQDLMLEVSKLNLGLDDINLDEILGIIFSVDFAKVLVSLELNENTLDLVLDLTDFNILDLTTVNLNVDYTNGIKLTSHELFDLDLALNKTTDPVEVLDKEYQNLTDFINTIIDLVSEKKLALTASLSYEDLDIEAEALVDFSQDLKLSANVTLTYDSKTIEANLWYLKNYKEYNDVILVHLANQDVMLEISKLNLGLDEMNLDDILGVIFSVDFAKVLVSLEQHDTVLDVALDLTNFNILNLTTVNLSADYTNGIRLTCHELYDLDLTVSKTTTSVEVLDKDYANLTDFVNGVVELVSDKKLALTASLSYDELDIEAEALVDFAEDLKLSANVTLAYDSKTIEAEVYYLKSYKEYEDVILVHLANQDLMLEVSKLNLGLGEINLDDILGVVFSVDFAKVLVSLEQHDSVLDLALDLTDFNILDLTTVNLNVDYTNGIKLTSHELYDLDITVNKTTDTVEVLDKDYQNLTDFINTIIDLVSEKKLALSGSISYEKLNAKINALVDFSDDLMLSADLNIDYDGLKVDATINYLKKYGNYEDVLLIHLGDNHLLLEISKLDLGLDEMSLDNILGIIFSVDFAKVLVSLESNEKVLDLALDLTDFNILDLTTVNLNIDYSDDIKLTSHELYDLDLTVSKTTNNVEVLDEEYVDLTELVTNVLDIVNWIKKDSFRIGLQASATIKGISFDVSGNVDFILDNEEYIISGKLNVYILDTNNVIDFVFKDEVLYLSYGNIHIGLDTTNLTDYINDVVEALGQDLDLSLDIAKLKPMIDSLVVVSNGASLDASSLVDFLGVLEVALTKNDSKYNVSLHSTDINGEFVLEKIDSHDVVVPTEYLDNDDLLELCKHIGKILNLIKERSFNARFDLSVFDDNALKFDIAGNLDLVLNLEEDKPFSLNDIEFKLTLAITEYTGNTVKVIHRVNLIWIGDYIYVQYGNNENNQSSQIKLYARKTSILSMVEALTRVLGMELDFLSEYRDSTLDNVDFSQLTELYNKLSNKIELDFASIVQSINITSTGIELGVNLHSILNYVPEDKVANVILNVSDNDISLSLSNLYTDYVSEAENQVIHIDELVIEAKDVTVKAPTSLSGYYDISEIDKLIVGVLTTASNKDYEISGSVHLKLLIIDVQVPIYAKVRVLEDGSPLVYLRMDLTEVPSLATYTNYTSLYYRDGYLIIHRNDRDGSVRDLKVTYQEFFDDPIYYILDASMGMKDLIMSNINSSSTDEDYVIDAGKVIQSYSYSTNKFTFTLSMNALTGNSNLGDMKLSLDLGTVGVGYDENENVKSALAFKSISNFSMDLLGGLIKLTSSSIVLTNFKQEKKYDWFTLIDMSDVNSFIDNYQYGTDMIFIDGKYKGKREHSITFILDNGNDPVIFNGQAGMDIVFPVLDVKASDGKYYVFDGWYLDKYKTEEFTGTKMSENSIKLYAKWREVNYYNLIIHSIAGDTTDSLYDGESLESYYNKPNVVVGSKTYVFEGYSLTEGGEVIPVDVMPTSDLELYAIYKEVGFKVYIDGSYYMDLDTDTNLSLTKNYALAAGNVYFEFNKEDITYDTLVNNYLQYALIDDNSGIFYLVSVDSLTDVYQITLDVKDVFDNKGYVSIILPMNIDFTYDLLPNGTYNHYGINYWYNDTTDFHSQNISLLEHVDQTLHAYYSTIDYLSFGLDSSNGSEMVSVTGFSYTGSQAIRVILPKYVLINGEYKVLEALASFADGEEIYSVFSAKTNIKAIYFNEGFKIIGANAFKNSTSLTDVYFSSTVKSVASDAFYFNGTSSDEKYAKQMKFYAYNNSFDLSKWLAYKTKFILTTSHYYKDITSVNNVSSLTSVINSLF